MASFPHPRYAFLSLPSHSLFLSLLCSFSHPFTLSLLPLSQVSTNGSRKDRSYGAEMAYYTHLLSVVKKNTAQKNQSAEKAVWWFYTKSRQHITFPELFTCKGMQSKSGGSPQIKRTVTISALSTNLVSIGGSRVQLSLGQLWPGCGAGLLRVPCCLGLTLCLFVFESQRITRFSSNPLMSSSCPAVTTDPPTARPRVEGSRRSVGRWWRLTRSSFPLSPRPPPALAQYFPPPGPSWRCVRGPSPGSGSCDCHRGRHVSVAAVAC